MTRLSSFSQWPSLNIIPGSISEAPYYAYLIGDLHPNLISISFQLLILAVLLNILIDRKITCIQAIMLGLMSGFFYPLNTWDYPVYIVIILAVVFLTIKKAKDSILTSGVIVIVSYVLYLPYHLSFQKVSEIAVISSGRTELIHYFLILGTFIFMISYYLINNIQLVKKDWLKWLAGLSVLIPFAFIIKFQLLVILVPLVFLAYSGLYQRERS